MDVILDKGSFDLLCTFAGFGFIALAGAVITLLTLAWDRCRAGRGAGGSEP